MALLRCLTAALCLLSVAPLAAQPSVAAEPTRAERAARAEPAAAGDDDRDEWPDPESSAASPIATDRPGNGNAATTVPQWALQIETSAGYALERLAIAGDQHRLAFPTFVRFGLLDIFEIRLGSPIIGIDASPPPGQKVAHPTDIALGLKVQLLANDGAVPGLALMTDVWLPSGRSPFSQGAVVPDMRAALSWSLPAGFGLLLNLGLDVPDDGVGRYGRAITLVNLGYAFPFAERRLSIFVEYYGLLPLADRGAVVQVDWGAAFRITHDMQIDFYAQHGLTDAATDFQIALGFSTRFFVH